MYDIAFSGAQFLHQCLNSLTPDIHYGIVNEGKDFRHGSGTDGGKCRDQQGSVTFS